MGHCRVLVVAASLMRPLILVALLLTSLCFPSVHSNDNDTTIGIGIGAVGESPESSPSPPDCGCSPEPQPSDFPNLKQYQVYGIIQRFKKTLTCDPNNVSATWVGTRPCTYAGFFCDAPPDSPTTPTIASVDFNGFGLCAPTLAGFLDRLPDLALFHANSNNFSGTLPALSALPFFAELDVSNNKLSGAFPAAVLPLSNLTFLDIRFNFFAGIVPAAAFQLNLDVFFLNNNLLSSPLPANLGSTTAVYLVLANNGFTGSIPPSIALAASTLVEVLLLNNRLSGCLPYEVGLLRSATVFDAGLNEITGPIPLSFGCLQSIEQLNLAGNLLYGHVSDSVCGLPRLENLSLSDNYFTSVGPKCWPLIRSGVLDVRQNCILGCAGQRPTAECVHFLLRPKRYYCPLLPHIPCSIHASLGGKEAVPSPPFRLATGPPPRPVEQQRRGHSPGPRYASYTALHWRNGP